MENTNKYSVIWDDFQENVRTSFKFLQLSQVFCDVTLVCEDNQKLEAHRNIISASSSLLMDMLISLKQSHPLIYFLDVKHRDLANLIEFIYTGQVQVYQSDLQDFLKVAKKLAVKGVSENVVDPKKTHSEHVAEVTCESEKVSMVESPKYSLLPEESFPLEDLHLEVTVKKENLFEHEPVLDNKTTNKKEENFSRSNNRKSKKPRTNLVWLYYDTLKDDISTVQCKTCSTKLSRGRLHCSITGSLGSGSMILHLRNCKAQGYKKFMDAKRAAKQCLYTSGVDQENYVYNHKFIKEKTSLIWRYFTTVENDISKAQCNHCNTRLSRGKLGTNMSNASMAPHLKAFHKEEYKMYQEAKEAKLTLKNSITDIKLKGIPNPKFSNQVMTFSISSYFEEDESDNSLLACQVGYCKLKFPKHSSDDTLNAHLHGHGNVE